MGTTTPPAASTPSSASVHSGRVSARMHTRSPGCTPVSANPRARARTVSATSANERSCQISSRRKRSAALSAYRLAPMNGSSAMDRMPAALDMVVISGSLRYGGQLDRNAVEHGGARQRIHTQVVGEPVGVDAGVLARDGQLHAGQVVPPAVRDAHHAGGDVVADLDGQLHPPD